jgi:hypothetical protein
MEIKELDNLSRTELFEVLKGKCKSNAKRDFYAGLMFLSLAILYLLFPIRESADESNPMIYFIFWIGYGCLSVWEAIYNYRLLKKIDNLDTPDELLYRIEKKHRYNIIFYIALWILLFIYIAMTGFDYVNLTIWIVATVVILFCFFKNLGWYGQDKEMMKQLRELVEKK